MSAPLNQRRLSSEDMVEQCRRNRRQAATLESRDGPQKVAKSAAQPVSRPASTVRK